MHLRTELAVAQEQARQLPVALAEVARLRTELARQQEHLQESMKRLNASYASADTASVDRCVRQSSCLDRWAPGEGCQRPRPLP